MRVRRTIERVLEFGGLGLAVFAAGVVVGGLIVYGLHKQHWLGDKEPRKPAAFSEVPEPRAGELAERFRPWLKFDSQEAWRPLNISLLLSERAADGSPAHTFCARPPATAGCTGIQGEAGFRQLTDDASALGASTFINLAGTSKNDYRGPGNCPGLADCGSGPRSAIYYHVTQSNDRFYIDYWWYLRFNNFYRSDPSFSCKTKFARENGICDEHEGDWEGVTVVTPPGDDKQLDYVVYAAHKGTFRYSGSQLVKHGGTRPDVYLARGSHAAYPRPCESKCEQPIAVQGLVALPESTFDGKKDWERDAENCKANAPGSCLLSLPRADRDPRAWTVWPGQWGGGCGDVCGGAAGASSPRSPGLQARFQTPWCSSQAGVFTCDGRALGCSDWLGPLVAAVACDPAVLSRGLRRNAATKTSALSLTVRGEESDHEETPGVVQTLGDPLSPGDRITVTGDSDSAQVLVRAQQGGFIVEARFDDLRLKEQHRAVIDVGPGTEGPTVLMAGREPVERRVLQVRVPTAMLGP